ncbi:MAG: DNA alkylation repair protein [Candidatus Omnitrophica bacterium]|nr:DNA alkylation repair protein [Candidatus Omnitrophota bacterium]
MSLEQLQAELRAQANPDKVDVYKRFFKTGPGEYGEGDLFLGVNVPAQRRLAGKYRDLNWLDTIRLLKSPYHEERLTALLIMIHQFERGDVLTRGRVYRFYLNNTRYINNWDLVDTSAHKICGPYLMDKDRTFLDNLARSRDLWKRRISIITTYYFIKHDQFDDTLRIAKILLHDKHDLIHKATGWMLREVGNRNQSVEEEFLDTHAAEMPRTMLRYAVEKFPPGLRKKYMTMK